MGTLTLTWLWACGDDGSPAKDMAREAAVDASVPDTATADLPETDTTPFTTIGEGCVESTDCTVDKGQAACLVVSEERGVGICSRECTPDDPDSLAVEDDCPKPGFVCASFTYTTKTYNYCLKKCTPDITQNTCPPSSKQTCHPVSSAYTDLGSTVCWYLACRDDKDCPVYSDVPCSNEADCASVGTGAFCEHALSRCARPGNCTPSGLCGPHTFGNETAQVGSPCTSDLDCPGKGRCWEESYDSDAIGPQFHNGYCVISGCAYSGTLPDSKCPAGSTCHNLYYGGICAKTCTLADDPPGSTCRGHDQDQGGDYECYAWNRLFLDAGPVTAEPVCMSAAERTCDSLGDNGCESIGDQGNPTHMGCRDRFTGVARSNEYDPTGVCLDDTASGPFVPVPDAGMDAALDASTPEGGTDAPATDTTPDAPATDTPGTDA